MTNLLHNFGKIIFGSTRNASANREIIRIGGEVFAVAHSAEEMTKMMRMRNQKVTGYVLQHHM
jgi:hypothetical protein